MKKIIFPILIFFTLSCITLFFLFKKNPPTHQEIIWIGKNEKLLMDSSVGSDSIFVNWDVNSKYQKLPKNSLDLISRNVKNVSYAVVKTDSSGQSLLVIFIKGGYYVVREKNGISAFGYMKKIEDYNGWVVFFDERN